MIKLIVMPALALLLSTMAIVKQQPPAAQKSGPNNAPVKELRDIKLTLTPVSEDGATPTKSYQVGDKVLIQLTMFNGSDEPVSIITGDIKFQHRLKLMKDGQKVAFRPEVSALIESKDREGPGPGKKATTDPVAPHQSATVSLL